MARCLIYRISDGLVVNSVIWDGAPGWSPPDGHAAVFDDTGAIGQLYNARNGQFSDPDPGPPAPPPEPTKVEVIVALLKERGLVRGDIVGQVRVLTQEEMDRLDNAPS